MLIKDSHGLDLINPGRAGILASLDQLIYFVSRDAEGNPVENYATVFSQDGLCSLTRWKDEHDRYWLSYTKQWIENHGYDFTREFPEIIVDAEFRELLVDLFVLLSEYGRTQKPELRMQIADAILDIQDEGHDLWPTLFPDEAAKRLLQQENSIVNDLPDSPLASLLQSGISECQEKDKSTEMDRSDKMEKSAPAPFFPISTSDSPRSIWESQEQKPTKIDQDCLTPCSGSPAPPTPMESKPWWSKTQDG